MHRDVRVPLSAVNGVDGVDEPIRRLKRSIAGRWLGPQQPRPGHSSTGPMVTTDVCQSRRTVPSRAGSAGVILRGWELITRPGCRQRPGQCEHCRPRSRSWTRPARGSTIRTSATA
jgi:hypothetical protein